MRLAIDAMGNDRGPEPIVEGAKAFLASGSEATVVLVGNQDRLRAVLSDSGLEESAHLQIVHASQVMEMHEKVGILREKRDSSIMRTVGEVKEGRADAMVALGNTAAAVGAAVMGLRVLKGVHRAGIAVPMPTRNVGRPCVTIDMGANTVCKAQHLVDYGIMASIYSERVLHIETPRVGLLNVGEERTKGNALIREVFEKLQSAPINFVGNVEGGSIFSGDCDVVVCDGFVGNAILKASEEFASTMQTWMKEAIQKDASAGGGAHPDRSALEVVRERASYDTYGGAPLLGVNGICIIGHGRSNARAVQNALQVASDSVSAGLNQLIQEQLIGLNHTGEEATSCS